MSAPQIRATLERLESKGFVRHDSATDRYSLSPELARSMESERLNDRELAARLA